MNRLREKLAAIEHEQWMAWSKSVADEVNLNRRARWIKLWVPYEQLPECEKESDRKWADHVIDALPPTSAEHPKVICLCGSTRFTREMLVRQWELTKQGCIVLSWCALPDDYYHGEEKAHIGDQEGVKEFVDEIHKRKIDISDEVLVIDVGGYIGTSTRSEIEYAKNHGKAVRYLSEEADRQQQERNP